MTKFFRRALFSFAIASSLGALLLSAPHALAKERHRDIRIHLVAKIEDNLPIRFVPAMESFPAKIGDRTKLSYFVKNFSEEPILTRAHFDATPSVAQQYVNKLKCFCFEDQTLEPGKASKLRVLFIIDPAINDDPDLKNFDDVMTFTYTFQRVGKEAQRQKHDNNS